MLRRGVFILAVLASAPAGIAHADGVLVDAGTLTATLTAELRLEGRTITTTLAEASAVARVRTGTAALEVQVRSPTGSLLAERRVETSEGLSPALRVVVLVIADATRPRAEAPPITAPVPTPIPPRPLDPGPRFGLHALATVSAWATPSAPQVGVTLELEPVRVELALSLDGAICCQLTRPALIDGTALEVALRATAGIRVFRLGPLEGLGFGGLGLSVRRVESSVLAFAAPAPLETQVGMEGAVRLGAGLELDTGGPRLLLRAGAAVRLGRVTVRLPEGFSADPAALDPGTLTPWGELGVLQYF